MSRPGNEGALRSSVFGLLLSGALLGRWGIGFVHGYQTAMQNRKAAQAITQTANEINKDLKKEVAEKGSITPGAGKDNAQKMKTALDNASKQLTGDWGNWKYNPEKKNVIFQDTSVVGQYNEYFKDMSDASKEQAQLQSKLVNLPAIASAQ